MLKIILNIKVLLLAVLFTSQAAWSAMSPIGISIVPPVQFPPDDFSVAGARFSLIYGQHRDVYGLDIGAIGNITDQKFVGLGIAGGFNYTKGATRIIGLQLAGLTNINTNKTVVYGFQIAGLANYNSASSEFYGVQLALANLSHHSEVNGLQVGIYNRAQTVHGLQIGLVNYTNNLKGLQIGLLNFYPKGVFSVSPILNFGF